MAEWKKLTAGIVRTDQINATADGIDAALTTLTPILQAIALGLSAFSALLTTEKSVVEQALGALVDALEQTILDVFQNNAAMAVHINLRWNPRWKYERGPNDLTNSTPDYAHDGALPWVGTGTSGWLLDVAYSTQNPTDRFRPVTDADTAVTGVIVVKGIPSGGAVQDLEPFFKLFPTMAEYIECLSPTRLKNVTSKFKSYLRLGPISYHETMKEVATGEPDERMGEMKAAVQELTAQLDPDFYSPKIGDSPFWVSVPLAGIFPPVEDLFDILKKATDTMRSGISQRDSMQNLADLLSQRAAVLRDIVENLNELLNTLTGIFAFFEDSYIFVGSDTEGGVNRFVNNAIAADGFPDFGERGVVVGFVALGTTDDPSNHFQSLFEMLGLKFTDYTSDDTVRAEGLLETWDAFFP